jgi:hypothetical protein
MASTIQEALINAGLTSRNQQVLAPHPDARSTRLPKWLTRNGRMTGPISDFFGPLHHDTHKVWLIHPSNKAFSRVLSIEPDGRFAHVLLENESEPRKFRLDAKVRYVLTAHGRRKN